MPDLARLPILKRGDTWIAVFTWRDAADELISLDGCAARLQLRDARDQLILDTDSSEAGALTIEPADATGEVHIRVEASDTAQWPVLSLDGDLEITWPDGRVLSTDRFYLPVEPDVTR
jgi:hypothetical protein